MIKNMDSSNELLVGGDWIVNSDNSTAPLIEQVLKSFKYVYKRLDFESYTRFILTCNEKQCTFIYDIFKDKHPNVVVNVYENDQILDEIDYVDDV